MKKIQKKDLTIEWLDENCEPIGLNWEINGKEVIKPTYKCYDYTVEVFK